MKNYGGLICYFPTTVMLIDDNLRFLTAIAENIPKSIINIIYDSPTKALKELKKREKLAKKNNKNLITNILNSNKPNNNSCETAVKFDINGTNTPIVNYNIPSIYESIYDNKRFEQISVLIVDYEMPKTNGLEFLLSIKNSPTKKVLLINASDRRIAAKAVKSGSIHQFIVKDTPNLCAELENTIYQLQLDYFRDISRDVSTAINAFRNPDRELINFFSKLCQTKQASEFYLLDHHGSFLLLDFSGNPLWFIVRNEQVMNEFHCIATLNNAAAKVIECAANRNAIPFFFTESDHLRSVIDWENYLYPAEKLDGENGCYYYSLITERCIGNLNYENILSHRNYLAKLNIFL